MKNWAKLLCSVVAVSVTIDLDLNDERYAIVGIDEGNGYLCKVVVKRNKLQDWDYIEAEVNLQCPFRGER